MEPILSFASIKILVKPQKLVAFNSVVIGFVKELSFFFSSIFYLYFLFVELVIGFLMNKIKFINLFENLLCQVKSSDAHHNSIRLQNPPELIYANVPTFHSCLYNDSNLTDGTSDWFYPSSTKNIKKNCFIEKIQI